MMKSMRKRCFELIAVIALAASVFDVLAYRVQFDGQALDVRIREMGERGDVCDCQRILLPWSRPTLA